MSTAYNPATGLYYLMTIENCGVYRSTMFGGGRGARPVAGIAGGLFADPNGDPPRRYLRAIEIATGKIAWEVEQKIPGPNYGGALSTGPDVPNHDVPLVPICWTVPCEDDLAAVG